MHDDLSSGTEATLEPTSREALDATMASEPGAPASSPPVTIRGGRPDDYGALQAVDPKHYVVGKEIARGGMGRILTARDRRLGRPVAIKELLYESRDARARFEREARITARLQHPAIVNILEAGAWPSGEPFYVMKLVTGESLDKAIDARETLEARLGLVPNVIAAVDALAYAHSMRVIHRDLKPGNVLVGEFGETVVIDWGLAKDLADPSGTPDLPAGPYRAAGRAAGETVVGSIMGTPAYMPAEQATGETVDERADVYALGAMLYHVLGGAPPYTGKTSDDVLQRVIKGPPPPLGARAPGVPPDLVAIVAKAMAHDRKDRYPTARELAEDLRRFQTGQLVGARRYSTAQRVRRFLARHRVVVGVITAALVVVAALSAFAIVRIVRARDAADQQRAVADQRRVRADTLRAASEDMVGFMLADLQPQLARVGRLDIMKGVGAEVDAYYQRLAEADEELDDAARARRAVAQRTLGDVLDGYGDVAGAKRAYETALETGAPLSAIDARVEAARARTGLALTLQEGGDLDGSMAALDQVRADLEALPAGTAGADLALALAYRRTGVIRTQRNELDEALTAFSSGLDRALAASAAAPADRTARSEVAKCHDRLSDVRAARNDLAGSLASARSGLAIREQLATEDPGDLENQMGLAVSWDKLYRISYSNNDADGARAAADAEIALIEPLVARDPANADWGRMLMVAYLRPAELAYGLDRPADAAKAIEKALAVAERLLALDPDNVDRIGDVNMLLGRQASYLTEAHQLDEALVVQRRALASAEALSARVPSNIEYRRGVGIQREYLGDVFNEQGKLAEAAAEYRARLAIDEELLRSDPDNPLRKLDVASTRYLLGDTIADLPAHYREGIGLMETSVAELHALRDAGQLSEEAISLIPEREQKLLVEKKRAR